MNNRTKDFLSVVLAACVTFATPALGATYYVTPTGLDASPGTQAAPTTPRHAIYLAHPGDTILLSTGTYPPLQINKGGANGQYVTLRAAPGQTPTFTKDGTAFNGITVQDGVSYLTIQGIHVAGNARSHTVAQADAANNTDYNFNGACIGTARTAHHINLIGNSVAYCPGAGIIYWGDYGVIQGNWVSNTSWWDRNARSGIIVVGSNISGLAPGTILVSGNYVFSNRHISCNNGTGTPTNPCVVTDGQGIIVDSNDNGGTYSNGVVLPPGTNYQGRIEIFNNIAYGNYGWGIVCHRCQHVDIYNNTTYKNGLGPNLPPPYNSTGGEVGITYANDVRVMNNIFYGNTFTPTAIAYGGATVLWIASVETNVVWDYNIIYTPPGGNEFYYYAPVPPLGAHDTMLDPLYTSWLQPPLAFQLTAGSPAIGSGTCTLQPTTDYLNKRRLPTRCDRGAFYGWH